jgi:hypothetical protein
MDVVTYHVIVLLGGSQVEEPDVFHGSSTLGCWSPQTYECGPPTNEAYTVQLLREGIDQPPEEARFQVGDPNDPAVGGEVFQVSSFQLFAPYIAISSIGALFVAARTFLRKRLRS